MRLSQAYWQTYKETPADAEIPSHKLLIRAGFLNKVSGGIYSYLPFATKVLQKIKKIIRDELNSIGAQELLMSFVTPAELWKSSGRWNVMGAEMLKLSDRKGAEFCLSATNEETITDIIKNTASSYKQLPINLYQINTKFRDEIRPRFGLMRGREFIMKDAYTFHKDKTCMDEIYQQYFQAYSNIFSKMGLEYIAVEADGGAMAGPGSLTHEFQIIVDNGEDDIVEAKEIGYAANIEAATTLRAPLSFATSTELEDVKTENLSTCEEVAAFLDIPVHQTLKTLAFTANYLKKDGSVKEVHYLFMLLGDDEANEIKMANCVRGAITLAPTTDEVLQELELPKGFMGPLKREKISVIVDSAIDVDAGYVVGANRINYHTKGFTVARDVESYKQMDIRLAKPTDFAHDGKTPIKLRKGMEVGHIFQLGDKYTKSMGAHVLDQNGKKLAPLMGCYGIGVSRLLAATVEQHHDENGIIWPVALAPFDVYFAFIGKKEATKEKAFELYNSLVANGIDVLFDDRGLGPGGMFKDADLLGLPIRVVLGERDFEQSGELEVKIRKSGDSIKLRPEELGPKLQEILTALAKETNE